MSRTRAPYPPESRRQMIELVEAGRSPEELAREFEPSAQTIRNWVVRAARDADKCGEEPTRAEREGLRQPRRENKRLREERAILAKATAWFARETDEEPSGSSRSSR